MEPELLSSHSAPGPVDHPFKDYRTVQDIQPDFRDFIVGLAKNFDGKRLSALKRKNKWLGEFEPRGQETQPEIDFEMSQEKFTNDGRALLLALQEYIKLSHQELANIFFSRYYGLTFPSLVAKLLELDENTNQFEIKYSISLNKHLKEVSEANLQRWEYWKNVPEFSNSLSKDPQLSECVTRSIKLSQSKPFSFRGEMERTPISEFRAIIEQKLGKDEKSASSEDRPKFKLCDFFNHVGAAWWVRYRQKTPLSYLEKNQAPEYFSCCSSFFKISDMGFWWYAFQTNLQKFASLVAGEKGSLSVDKNMKTLQALNENRMHYVSMMQKTIQQLNGTISEQQRVITALKFRYLLETLPGPAYAHLRHLSERWKAFWEDITRRYKEEKTDTRTPIAENSAWVESEAPARDLALEATGGVAVGGKRAQAEDIRTAENAARERESDIGTDVERGAEAKDATTAEGPATIENTRTTEGLTANQDNPHGTNAKLDDLFGRQVKSKIETKGRELYSDLSDIIHRYNGNKYEFDDVLFGPTTSDILRALAPELEKDGQLEVDKERLRYSHFVEHAAKTRAEKEDKKSNETVLEVKEPKEKKPTWQQTLGETLGQLVRDMEEIKKLHPEKFGSLEPPGQFNDSKDGEEYFGTMFDPAENESSVDIETGE